MFSILIPTWNNLEYLRLCVDGIRRNSAHTHQIVVHVNDGSDGTREWVRGAGLDTTFSESNVGVCWALNEAATRARREFIVCFDDDVYCLPGWDVALMHRARQMPGDLFLLSATSIAPRGGANRCAVVADHGRTPAEFREAELLTAALRLARADWSGATWLPTLVHRRWWFKCGGYSTELSPGASSGEDFSMKLWHAGCRHFVGVGNSLVYQFQRASAGLAANNDGPRQFLHKWGMTPATFDRYYLRRGQALAGDAALSDPRAGSTPGLKWALRRGAWRRRWL
jgi:glycosyltransferase involved in cell wall biosynthesis